MSGDSYKWGDPRASGSDRHDPRVTGYAARSSQDLEADKRGVSPAFTRLFLPAFAIAAGLGLLIGLAWTIVGLWHFHVHRLW